MGYCLSKSKPSVGNTTYADSQQIEYRKHVDNPLQIASDIEIVPSVKEAYNKLPNSDSFAMEKSALKSAAEVRMFTALEECCNRSDEYFLGTVSSVTQTNQPSLSPMEQLAHKCVSVKFLLEIYEKVVQPYRPTMTVKEVVDEIIIPATKEKQCSFIDQLRPNMYVVPHAFVSHAFNNPFHIIVEYLRNYFKDAIYAEVYVWIDIFIINQHRPGDDLHDGLTLKATIQASGSVLVCLDKSTLPLFRLWCLYEIGSTPTENLVLLTHGFDATELGLAYDKIDATTADCFSKSDKERIQGHIRNMMVEHKIVPSGASILEALVAFTRVLKLLLILKPTSYSADIAALLARADGYERYPLMKTVERACTGGKLVVIAGNSGDGKSTLAAALVDAISIDAYHFCKQSDIRRQDIGLIIRSLSYQLAIRFQTFAQALLAMTSLEVESLSDELIAFKLLLETPLRAARGSDFQATILIDALDESGGDGRIISLLVRLDNIMREVGSSINLIVTTRPDTAILYPLRSHWKGECYIEYTPAQLRGEVQAGIDQRSPLLKTLTAIVRQQYSDDPNSIYHAYGLIFNRGVLDQHREVLEVVMASYEPRSLSDLNAMGLLEMARRLPAYDSLFLERENKLHLLHRSITEWLLDPGQGAIDIKSGHSRLAEHIWKTTLRPWLVAPSCMGRFDNSREPNTGSYSLKYAVAHLREADRYEDIQVILFRLPFLQAILKEKDFGGLMKDVSSLTHSPALGAATKKLAALLRLSSFALQDSSSWNCLPAQLLGRLRETEHDALFQSLREEANSFPSNTWLKPLKSSLRAPGNLEMTMIGHEGGIQCISALPDGRVVSGSEDNTFRIWNMTTGDCEHVFSGHERSVTSLVALSDGRVVSCSSDNTLRVWNIITGDCEKVLNGHERSVSTVIVLPDDRIVSGSFDRTLRVWNMTTGDCEGVFSGHTSVIKFIIALSGGRIVSCSGDKTLRMWSINTGCCELVFSGHEDGVLSAVALSNDRIVSCSSDKTLRVWHTTTGDCEKVLSGHGRTIWSVIALSDGRIISCSDDTTLRVWNSVTGDCEKVLFGHDLAVTSVVALHDGRIVSCSNDKTLRVWNLGTGDCDYVFSGHESVVVSAIALFDGRIVSCSDDNTLRVWNMTTGDVECERSGHGGAIWSVITLSNGRLVSCSQDKTLRVWNISTGDCEQVLSGHEGGVHSVIALPNDRLVSRSGEDKTLRMWNMATGDCEHVFSGHEKWINAVIALSDGNLVSCSDDKTLRLWNGITGCCDRVLSGHERAVTSVVELHDARILSCSTDKTSRVWNLRTGDCEQVLSEHQYRVCEIKALPDGRLISLDLNDNCRLWSYDGVEVRSETLSKLEFDRLSRALLSANIGSLELGLIAPGYSVSGNWVVSESFGRVFVDGPVKCLGRFGDVVVVFQENGRDHWFREVSN